MNALPEPKSARRTQAERSDAMRSKLIHATLESLAEDGFAACTLSSIVRRAGVSRGAQVHHYPSKQALLMDTAEYIVKRTYRELGEIILSVADEDDRLGAIVDASWERLFNAPLFSAYFELLVASQSDTELAAALRKLLIRMISIFEPATRHYFQPGPGASTDVQTLFNQFAALCVGLAAHAHLMDDDRYIKMQLKQWILQINPLIKPRKGVKKPPPRPADWQQY